MFGTDVCRQINKHHLYIMHSVVLCQEHLIFSKMRVAFQYLNFQHLLFLRCFHIFADYSNELLAVFKFKLFMFCYFAFKQWVKKNSFIAIQSFTPILLVCKKFMWEESNDKKYVGSKLNSVFLFTTCNRILEQFLHCHLNVV
jgi:hypothetical protein